MANGIDGAVALVTGGANGIGAAAARRLAARGARVVVADALRAVLASDRTGEAWYVQPGRPAEPFAAFRNVPGPRAPDGSRIGGPSPGCLNRAAG
jgi:NAD(P)-dependent dehydrogenase (short-subunit alcohol dehydrogenase family)